jgi:hypothetical protein
MNKELKNQEEKYDFKPLLIFIVENLGAAAVLYFVTDFLITRVSTAIFLLITIPLFIATLVWFATTPYRHGWHKEK